MSYIHRLEDLKLLRYLQIKKKKISPNSDIDSRIYKLKSHFFQNAIFQNVFCYLTKSSRICLEKQIAKSIQGTIKED